MISTTFKALTGAVLAVLLVACAGQQFERIPNSELVLNQTTMTEISARLGKPYTKVTSLKNGEQIQSRVYSFATTLTAPGLLVGMASDRTQTFQFHEGKLVGYEYSSNFSSDSTRFDDTVISGFKEGRTTRADVIRALGEPVGESTYPVVDTPGDRAIRYVFAVTLPSLKRVSKSLTVEFGPDDVAKKISFAESNPR